MVITIMARGIDLSLHLVLATALLPGVCAVAGEPTPAAAACVTARAAHADHSFHRAGHPECVACYALPSETAPHAGGYVGGGCAVGGCARGRDQGTWGWDYCGGILGHHPWLGWCHGRRCQGGAGAYRSDGPRVPNPLGHFGF